MNTNGSIGSLFLSMACFLSFTSVQSQECMTADSIEDLNRGVSFDRTIDVEGELARIFVALDPVWSMPDFEDVPYRHPDDMQRLRDEFRRLMQEDIDEIIVWRLRRTMGAAIPFSDGCAVEGYGEPDDLDKLDAMYDVLRLISNRGIDHPSVRRGIGRILEPTLERYQMPSLTSESSYEKKIDKVIDRIRPLLSSSTTAERVPADRAPDTLEIAAYDAIVVGEFEDYATENAQFRGDTPQAIAEAREDYRTDLDKARRNFRELLIQEVQRTNVYSEVVSAGTLPTGRALLIEGEITQFDRGNLTTRFLVGLGAGRVRFDATVRIKDASTGTEITAIDIGRGSGIIGGALGMAITVEYYMQRSAMSIASQLREERCAAIVCEEPPPLTVTATEDADRVAKEFEVREDECLAYVYVSLPGNDDNRRGVEVWLDDSEAGVMDSEDGYFLWSLEVGEHAVSTRYLSKSLQRSIDVECVGGDVIFIHHEVAGPMIERLLREPVKQGQRDVQRRQLFLARLDD